MRSYLEEYAERLIARRSMPNILENAFTQQVAFIKDPARKKALFCTRRSAKSFTAGLYLIYTALHYDNVNCLFIALTRASAEAIIWKDILKHLNQQYGLNADFNETKLRMRFPNGSEITVCGVDADQNEMNKLLGRKNKLVCIDEASMYTINVSNMVDLIEPATVDQGGTICLMGTASNFPRGLFFEVSKGMRRDWKLYAWSAHDNPYVSRQWKEKLAEIAKDRPEYMETPQFKQWYLNEWITDEEKRVYKFEMGRNLCNSLPILADSGWTYVLGVDTGWEDDSAFALTAYHINDPNLYVFKTYKKKKMTFDEVCLKIEEFQRDPVFAPHKIVIDGANKQGVESMRARSAIPFEYADKLDKATFIELCNADLIQKKIKIVDTPENRPLWEEMSTLVWVTDPKDADKIKYPKKEHPNLPNHLCDAFLYAWRCGYHYSSQPAQKKVIKGSREWYETQAESLWEREREQLMRADRNDWPEQGSLGDLG